MRTWHVVMIGLCMTVTVVATAQEAENLLTVSGQATVFAEPDNIRVNVGVRTIKEDLDEARSENAVVFGRILSAIEALDYPDMFLKSTAFDVSLIEEPQSVIAREVRAPRVLGYRISNRLEVRLTGAEVEELGARAAAVVDTAIRNGANIVDRLQIFVLDEEKHRQEALLEAVRNAREKAEAIAEELGVRIVGYKRVQAAEGVTVGPWRSTRAAEGMMGPAGPGAPVAPIEAGLVQITTSVTLSCVIAGR